jgi:hypothetical protein
VVVIARRRFDLERDSDALVDRASADRGDIPVLTQRCQTAEHLLAQFLNVLGTEPADSGRQSDGLQQAALLPPTHSVLVHAKGLRDLSDLH